MLARPCLFFGFRDNSSGNIGFSTRKELNMDVIEELKAQHRFAEQLLGEIEAAEAPEAKERLTRELTHKLDDHMKFEESIFYPMVESVDPSLVEEGFREHENCRQSLRKLQGPVDSTQEFDTNLNELKKLINHHVEEEERSLFPKCQEQLDEATLTQMGLEMEDWLDRSEKPEAEAEEPRVP